MGTSSVAALPSLAGRKYELQKLSDIHHALLRRIHMGQREERISRELGISVGQISNVRNSAIGQDMLRELKGTADNYAVETHARIKEMLPAALDYMEGVIDGREDVSHSIRVGAVRDILDRAGFAPVKEVNKTTVHLTGRDIDALKESAKSAGIAIDVTPNDESACSHKPEAVPASAQAAAPAPESVQSQVPVATYAPMTMTVEGSVIPAREGEHAHQE